MTFTKLSALVKDSFIPTEYKGMFYKKWDAATNKMETSEEYKEGFKKVFTFETNKGTLDLSSAQLGQMLVAAFEHGKGGMIQDQEFVVKSNGKTGMDIRYYINLLI